jgi:hypothetical protein
MQMSDKIIEKERFIQKIYYQKKRFKVRNLMRFNI